MMCGVTSQVRPRHGQHSSGAHRLNEHGCNLPFSRPDAGHLTTREFVTGCGSACKALARLQPWVLEVSNSSRNISTLVPGNVESAVSWLVRASLGPL